VQSSGGVPFFPQPIFPSQCGCRVTPCTIPRCPPVCGAVSHDSAQSSSPRHQESESVTSVTGSVFALRHELFALPNISRPVDEASHLLLLPFPCLLAFPVPSEDQVNTRHLTVSSTVTTIFSPIVQALVRRPGLSTVWFSLPVVSPVI